MISAPNFDVTAINISGITPLICHRFSEKERAKLDQPKTSKKAPREARDPDGDYKRSMYVMEDGRYGFPAAAFRLAMVRAAKHIDGLDMTSARVLFVVIADGRTEAGEECVALVGEPQMREDVVRVQRGGSTRRYRGEFLDWAATVRIRYDADLIGPDSLASLLIRAGMTVGVGEWRPEKNGTYGQFTIEGQSQ